MQPYFSIIIPVFNGEARLAPTLDSVCRQTFRDFEIIVVDDGSMDNTSKIVSCYCEKYLQQVYYFYKENGGVSSARNVGLEKAEGVFVIFLDSDDFLDENYLQKMYDELKGTDKKWACCVNKENGKINWSRFTYTGEGGLLKYILGGGNLPQTACWVIKRSLLTCSGMFFDEEINYTEDYNFFCKLLYYAERMGIKGGYLREPLVDYSVYCGTLCQRERLWIDLKHLADDFKSTKDIYRYIERTGREDSAVYLRLLRVRLKKKYLYNLWGTLLLGELADFKCLRRMYVEDKKIYSLFDIGLGMKYFIWEWATRPIICYLTLILYPYKRFQKFRQRKKYSLMNRLC